MNPPDPHNTNASPPTFSELLAKATPGPFPPVEARRPYDDDKPEGYLESDRDYIKNNEEAAVYFLDNAELITRLLNFAHAGGVDLIVRLTECAEMLDSRIRSERETPGGQTTASPDIRRAKTLLAVLNGQTK